MTPGDFVSLLWEVRATAILRTDDARVAGDAMDAAIRGGFRVVEVTLTTPGALELVRDLAARPGIVVGAGTVLEIAQARAAVAAGARFLVSPVVDAAVIGEARALGVASLPGVHTPTEALAAHRAGAPLVKLFPAPAGGPAWVRSCLGPMPFLRIVPTNGVDPANAASWLEAGAWAVGCVAALFDPGELRAGRFEAVEDRARALLASVGSVRRAPAAPAPA